MNVPQPRPSHRAAALLGTVLCIVGLASACSIDVPRAAYGVKSDEATYVAMALSLAHDWNLTYEPRDLERFTAIYHAGPEGIFLKPGQRLRLRLQRGFPFVRLVQRPDNDTSRLYFGKAFLYSAAGAPFVRLFGLNGLLIFHVLLITAVGVCGYVFLVTHSPPAAALVFTAAFMGAAAFPIYGVFLMPEIFNFSLVFFAYFLWLYKEQPGVRVRADPRNRLALTKPWTDIAAAALLGLATYSKPLPVAFLVAPLVLFAWWRRRWVAGVAVGATAVAVCVACFGITAAISGDWNYQGGRDRLQFYGRYPFASPRATWEAMLAERAAVTTDGTAAVEVLTSREAPRRFVRNVKYFLLGRHFGFIPYYFPGFVAIAAWLFSRTRRDAWRVLVFVFFAVATVGLLLVLPFTWSGGGGPPGNRYLLSAYPVLFFLVPPMSTPGLGLVAWFGGALFTAKMLVNPFVSAKFTWEVFEAGPARILPVELSMAGDLPVMLATDPLRGRIEYWPEPGRFLLLYFLDANASPPEPEGMWVTASGRADIIVRSVAPMDHMQIEALSPIHTELTVSLGGDDVDVRLEPGKPALFDVPAPAPVPGADGVAYMMSAWATEGFIPHLRIGNGDYRHLAAQLKFRAVDHPD